MPLQMIKQQNSMSYQRYVHAGLIMIDLSISLSVCHHVWQFGYLFDFRPYILFCISMYVSVRVYYMLVCACQSVFLSICLSLCLSLSLSVTFSLSFHLSIYLDLFLATVSTHLSIQLANLLICLYLCISILSYISVYMCIQRMFSVSSLLTSVKCHGFHRKHLHSNNKTSAC